MSTNATQENKTGVLKDFLLGSGLVVQGDLAKQCADLLNKEYKKEVTDKGIVLESQQIDDANRIGLFAAMVNYYETPVANPLGLVYATDTTQADFTDVTRFYSAVISMNDDQRAKSCLVTADGDTHNTYGQELINLATQNDVRVATLGEFTEEYSK
jgi:hypothetical protein